MSKVYPSEPAPVKPAILPDDVLLSIGKLVRACAEIEDILDLFISGLAGIDESKTGILLGRTAMTRRIEIALELANLRTDGAAKLHAKAFDTMWDDIVFCRNAIAHGSFMGETEHGFAFRTAIPGPIKGETKLRTVVVFPAATIHDFATIATKRVPELERLFEVVAQRIERQTRSLLPHKKAQPRASAERQPPPQSSQG